MKVGDRFEDRFFSWDDSVKMDLKGMESEGTDWILLAQDRNKCLTVVSTAINRRVL